MNIDYIEQKNNSRKLIIIFHGYGASMHDLAGLYNVISNAKEFDWIFPNGPLTTPMPMEMSRAWFPIDIEELNRSMMTGIPRDYSDKDSPDFQTALEYSKDFINKASENYDEVIIGGFSQGSMLTSHLVTINSKIKGLLALSSTLIAQDRLVKSLNSLEHNIQVFQSHGQQDDVLNVKFADNLNRLLSEYKKLNIEYHKFSGGHEIPMDIIQKMNSWLMQLV